MNTMMCIRSKAVAVRNNFYMKPKVYVSINSMFLFPFLVRHFIAVDVLFLFSLVIVENYSPFGYLTNGIRHQKGTRSFVPQLYFTV